MHISFVKNQSPDNLLKIAGIAAITLAFSVSTSVALISLSSAALLTIFLLLLLFFSRTNISSWKNYTWDILPIRYGLLLLGLIIISVLYSGASFQDAWYRVGHYRKLLYLPILWFALINTKWQKLTYYAFLLGMAVNILVSYARFFGWLSGYDGHGGTEAPYAGLVERIAGSIFLAFTLYALCLHFIESARYRWFLGISIALIFIDLFFLCNGRTGQLIFFILILLLTSRFFQWKGIILALILSILMGFTLYHTFSNFKDRISIIPNEIKTASKVDFTTFTFTRTELYIEGTYLSWNHPILGGGAGSFSEEFKQAHLKGGYINDTFYIEHPHNEFLLIYYEQGILGLCLLLLFFVSSWKMTSDKDELNKWLARGLIITMIAGCLLNSLLNDLKEGHFYIILLATFLSSQKFNTQFTSITDTQRNA